MSKKRFSLDSLSSLPVINSSKLEVPTDLNSLGLSKQDAKAISDIIVKMKHPQQITKQPNISFSTGLSILLTGENSLAKLSVAAHIANRLNSQIYRVDLGQIVNKFIGKTEKNMSRIFDAAKGSNTILYFDEADALFGKRTGVRDSHDKFANIEVSYLLQKMEQYRGLMILSSNFKSNIDVAFLRRIRSVLNFPRQHIKERKSIWGRMSFFFSHLLKKKSFIDVVEIDGSEIKRRID